MLNIAQEKDRVKNEILGKLRRHFGCSIGEATEVKIYKACALTIRDKIMEKWADSRDSVRNEDSKKLYYLSFEFLMGRALINNIMNLMSEEVYTEALKELGVDISRIEQVEHDAGLGNGGLGRLAACILDSLTTLNYPAYGSTIRYEYGIFKQKIIDGYQIEMPDTWLEDGSVWEIERPEEQVEIKYGGVVHEDYVNGRMYYRYENSHTVIGVPYDMPVSGYSSKVVNTLRLWGAKSPVYMDMSLFNEGDYIKATEERQMAEVISKVLYPEDNHYEGKALRLKQQYFFVSCTIQWILKEFKKRHSNILTLPDKVAIHINDTHPTLAIPEMMRLLMDNEGLSWDKAWGITTKVFGYTNHTIMSEALETWPLSLFKSLLPRIYMVVSEINERFCKSLWNYFPNDFKRISNMSIVAYDQVRMANLCLATCYAVNGVSQLHTDILKNDVFNDFYIIHPDRFHSITNGVTHRRWLKKANPELSDLITKTIGSDWILKPEQLKKLEPYATDTDFQEEFRKIKENNKKKLAKYILDKNGIFVDENSIFDVQVKRLHEYKRQLLNVLHILYQYNSIISNPDMDFQPKTYIFGAKASPGYGLAKLIIKLINTIAVKINNDPRVKDKLKVVFIENYGVSIAELIVSAAEISEQISTAGKEASGTGNMKFMMNGALTVGTLDGANVEMLEQVGEDNIFIFGMNAEEVNKIYRYGRSGQAMYDTNLQIKKVVDMLIDGSLEPDMPSLFKDIYNTLVYGNGFPDVYMVLSDFEDYIATQEKVSALYRQKDIWLNKAILNVANSGFFSSDRTVTEYADKIWKIKPIKG